jgi:hypothetical protein
VVEQPLEAAQRRANVVVLGRGLVRATPEHTAGTTGSSRWGSPRLFGEWSPGPSHEVEEGQEPEEGMCAYALGYAVADGTEAQVDPLHRAEHPFIAHAGLVGAHHPLCIVALGSHNRCAASRCRRGLEKLLSP